MSNEKMIDLENLFEDIKKNRKAFSLLKSAAIMAQNFQQAAHMRDMEEKLFPSTAEENTAKKLAEEAELLFRMVDLQVTQQTAWLIYNTVLEHQKLKGDFSIKDAAILTDKAKNIFD